jgi:hypothetical protein
MVWYHHRVVWYGGTSGTYTIVVGDVVNVKRPIPDGSIDPRSRSSTTPPPLSLPRSDILYLFTPQGNYLAVYVSYAHHQFHKNPPLHLLLSHTIGVKDKKLFYDVWFEIDSHHPLLDDIGEVHESIGFTENSSIASHYACTLLFATGPR